MKLPDPREAANTVVYTETDDDIEIDVARAGMLAALKWAVKHTLSEQRQAIEELERGEQG